MEQPAATSLRRLLMDISGHPRLTLPPHTGHVADVRLALLESLAGSCSACVT